MFNFKNSQAPAQNEQKNTKREISLKNKPSGATISSREIAEMTGKLHKNIIRDVQKMQPAWEKATGLKFELSEYTDITGRKLPLYQFNKLEYMYIISKFSDDIRARLVLRWYELEKEQRRTHSQQRLHAYEKPMFDILNKWLVRGDIKEVAKELGFHRMTVSRVKNGHSRNTQIIQALIRRCKQNKEWSQSRGYNKKLVQLEINFFNA